MKLPKFTLINFNGDPLKWTPFIETFDETVNLQDRLWMIEKFSYLARHLEGAAADRVWSSSLTSKNYVETRKLFQKRLGNTQVYISVHMNVLLKLTKLNSGNVVKLTSFYNAIESNLRSVMTMGLNPSHYGLLLIRIILEHLPDLIKLIVTQKLGKNNLHISYLIICIKEEVDAHENGDFIKDKRGYEHLRKATHLLRILKNCRISYKCNKGQGKNTININNNKS